MSTTSVSFAGVTFEVSYTYTKAYRGSETDPPEPASIELERVAVRGFPHSDLYDALTPGALASIEEQIMEAMEDRDYD